MILIQQATKHRLVVWGWGSGSSMSDLSQGHQLKVQCLIYQSRVSNSIKRQLMPP